MDTIERVRSWSVSGGRNAYLRYLAGERLTPREVFRAKCAECCGGYSDGKRDCRIKTCPIYPFMPYRDAVDSPSFPVEASE